MFEVKVAQLIRERKAWNLGNLTSGPAFLPPNHVVGHSEGNCPTGRRSRDGNEWLPQFPGNSLYFSPSTIIIFSLYNEGIINISFTKLLLQCCGLEQKRHCFSSWEFFPPLKKEIIES